MISPRKFTFPRDQRSPSQGIEDIQLVFNWPVFSGDYSRLSRVPNRSSEDESLGIAGSRFFASWMPLLSPNQQCQSTEETGVIMANFVAVVSVRTGYVEIRTLDGRSWRR